MFNKNNLIIVLFCILFLFSVSSVCAADNTTVSEHVTVHNATFSDLEKDIANLNPGDNYALEQDYIFDIKNDPSYVGPKIGPHGGILISKDNITINGNGHIIDGNHNTAIFRITGNNVKIFNLTIKNSEYRGWEVPIDEIIYGKPGEPITINKVATHVNDISPVYWSGDNGTINNCIFTGNTAINGAGITWKGDNGSINNTQFINNTARGVAGAIFITYANNTNIENCLFRNCTSLLGEAVYLDRKHGNYTLRNNTFQDQELLIIDGKDGIDTKYLQYRHYTDFTDKRLNIVPYLFKSIITGQMNLIDNNTAYYSQIDVNSKNETMFTLNIFRTFLTDNITYQKEYQFNNLKDVNEIFEALIHAKYQNSAGIIKNIFINNKNDYDALFSKNYQELVGKTEANTLINKDKTKMKDLTKCMNIYFNSSLSINSKTAFKVCSDFKVVNINGNGAKISGGTEKNDKYKWLENKEQYYTINNLTVSGFNHAIYNYYACSLNNVILSGNNIVFSAQPEDWGSAIVNIGTCTCTNTTFKDNHARCGGAIFNQGTLNLENCPFIGNSVEKKGFVNNMGLGTSGIGKDICNAGNGKVNIKNTDPFIDKPEVDNAGGLKATGHAIVSIVAPLVTVVVAGVIGGLTKNVAAGIAVGGLVGAAAGAIGSAIVCYNTFDATYPFLKYSLTLTISCVVAGAVTGGLAAYAAKCKANTKVQEQINERSQSTEEISVSEENPIVDNNVNKNSYTKDINIKGKKITLKISEDAMSDLNSKHIDMELLVDGIEDTLKNKLPSPNMKSIKITQAYNVDGNIILKGQMETTSGVKITWNCRLDITEFSKDTTVKLTIENMGGNLKDNSPIVFEQKNNKFNLNELFKENENAEYITKDIKINDRTVSIESSPQVKNGAFDEISSILQDLENEHGSKIQSAKIYGKQKLFDSGIGFKAEYDYYGVSVTFEDGVSSKIAISPKFHISDCIADLDGSLKLTNSKILYESLELSDKEMNTYGFKESNGGYSRKMIKVGEYGEVPIEYPSEIKNIPFDDIGNSISKIGSESYNFKMKLIKSIKIVNKGSEGYGIIVKSIGPDFIVDNYFTIEMSNKNYFAYFNSINKFIEI